MWWTCVLPGEYLCSPRYSALLWCWVGLAAVNMGSLSVTCSSVRGGFECPWADPRGKGRDLRAPCTWRSVPCTWRSVLLSSFHMLCISESLPVTLNRVREWAAGTLCPTQRHGRAVVRLGHVLPLQAYSVWLQREGKCGKGGWVFSGCCSECCLTLGAFVDTEPVKPDILLNSHP